MNSSSPWKLSRTGAALPSGSVLLLGLLVAAGLVSYRRSPVHVRRHVATTQELVLEVFGTGTLEAERTATLSPELVGRLATVVPREGAEVAAGEVVATLDAGELTARVRVAEAALGTAEAARARLQADIDRAHAAVHLAELEDQRARTLRSRRATSSAEVDRRGAELSLARAALARAQGELTEGEARVHAAQRTLEHRRSELALAQVQAPFPGLVTERVREPGDIAGPGAPIMRLVDPASLRVEAWVDEGSLGRLQPGQPTLVQLRSATGPPASGSLVGIRSEVDRETRELLVYVGPDEVPHRWALGQRVDIQIEVGRRRTLAVPEEFVRFGRGQPEVLVEDSGEIQVRRVQLGARSRGDLEVLEGISEGAVLVRALADARPLEAGWKVARR